jgi:hypothetical protein
MWNCGSPLPPVAHPALVKLFGGQGTINVNSWAPDSTLDRLKA